MAVPKDVRKTLEEAGVKFDDQGNIIEDLNETFMELGEGNEEDDDDLDDQDDDLEEDEGDDDDDESDDTDEDSDEGDDDSDEEEEPEPKKRKKKTKKDKTEDTDDDGLPKLTPKQLQKQKSDDDDSMSEIRRNLKAILEKGNDLKSDDQDDDDTQSALQDLRKEAEEFRKLRFQTFANNIRDRVKQSNYGVPFDDIINSTQWEEFLNKKAYGSRIGDLYRSAIQSQDSDSVLFFFDDFASKYLQRASKKEESVNKQKDDLDDLSVPDKTKTSGSPKKRRQYDYEEADYITKLDEAERGIITREDFVKFSDSFESALSKGRVKPSR